MAVNYEILFARAYNQLPIAKTLSNRGVFGTNKSIFFTLSTRLADYMLNADNSSLVSKRPFSDGFHFTLNPLLSVARKSNQHSQRSFATDSQECPCNLTAVRAKLYNSSLSYASL